MKLNIMRKILLLLGFLLATGCSLGPDFQRPETQLPASYQPGTGSGLKLSETKWEDIYQDPELKTHIKTALDNNQNLQIAMYRIDEAAARLGYVRADQLPRIDISGSAERGDTGKEVYNSIGISEYYSTGGYLSFELDLWGRVRRATEAERAALLSSQYAASAVSLALISSVASTYYELIDLDQRLAITQETVSNRKKFTKLIKAKFEGGIISELDLNQALMEEANAEALAAALLRQLTITENTFNVLLGRAPQSVMRAKKLDEKFSPKDIELGFPAELLERRPDVRAAEEQAHAALAAVGEARASRLPRLALTGTIGVQSNTSNNLFTGDARTWSIAGGLFGPLLDFGKARSYEEIAKAQAQQAFQNYELQVIQAVKEVEDALSAMRTYHTEYQARLKERTASARAAFLSHARYDDGLTPYLEVLDSDRAKLNSELNASAALKNYNTSTVNLYKALGGGWDRMIGTK